MLKAKIEIRKSFDENCKRFQKILEKGDLENFFNDECKYLDNLSDVLNSRGKIGDSFELTYNIEIKKED